MPVLTASAAGAGGGATASAAVPTPVPFATPPLAPRGLARQGSMTAGRIGAAAAAARIQASLAATDAAEAAVPPAAAGASSGAGVPSDDTPAGSPATSTTSSVGSAVLGAGAATPIAVASLASFSTPTAPGAAGGAGAAATPLAGAASALSALAVPSGAAPSDSVLVACRVRPLSIKEAADYSNVSMESIATMINAASGADSARKGAAAVPAVHSSSIGSMSVADPLPPGFPPALAYLSRARCVEVADSAVLVHPTKVLPGHPDYATEREKTRGVAPQTFNFDSVFDCGSTQREVSEAIAMPITRAVVSGYNGCVLAYGQTSSGKTHTISGALEPRQLMGLANGQLDFVGLQAAIDAARDRPPASAPVSGSSAGRAGPAAASADVPPSASKHAASSLLDDIDELIGADADDAMSRGDASRADGGSAPSSPAAAGLSLRASAAAADATASAPPLDPAAVEAWEKAGLLPRIVTAIFEHIESPASTGIDFKVTVECVEIYLERIRDLLVGVPALVASLEAARARARNTVDAAAAGAAAITSKILDDTDATADPTSTTVDGLDVSAVGPAASTSRALDTIDDDNDSVVSGSTDIDSELQHAHVQRGDEAAAAPSHFSALLPSPAGIIGDSAGGRMSIESSISGMYGLPAGGSDKTQQGRASLSSRASIGSGISARSSISAARAMGLGGELSSDNLPLREDKDRGVYVEGALTAAVQSPADIYACVLQANKNRAVAATNMNASSSRSHVIVRIGVEKRHLEGEKAGVVTRSTLFIVDLAGSEKVRSAAAWESATLPHILALHR